MKLVKRGMASPIIALILCLSFGALACAGGEIEEQVVDENQTDDNQQNDQNDQNAQNDQNDDNDNKSEPDMELSEAHQICAAAGEASDGTLTALHCFGPHDLSGFEASDGEHTWQPGAFNVVAQ